MCIRVIIADHKAVVRKAIRRVLEFDREIELVGEAENFTQTIQMAVELKPQVLVMDLHMPDGTDGAATDIRKALAPTPYLLAMSFAVDDEAKDLAASFGAQKLLDKMTLYHELIPAIREATVT